MEKKSSTMMDYLVAGYLNTGFPDRHSPTVKYPPGQNHFGMGSMATEHPTKLSSSSEYSDFLSKFDTFLLDCDG
jgi:hypothetical protein